MTAVLLLLFPDGILSLVLACARNEVNDGGFIRFESAKLSLKFRRSKFLRFQSANVRNTH